MEYENNTVAKIFKIYAILNAVACFIFMYVLIAADYHYATSLFFWDSANSPVYSALRTPKFRTSG